MAVSASRSAIVTGLAFLIGGPPVLEAFQASVSHDVSEYARDIRVPTLLVAAERDDVTPIEAQRRLVTLFPDATLEVIPEVGHLIHYETPGDAAARILRFLRSGARA